MRYRTGKTMQIAVIWSYDRYDWVATSVDIENMA